MVSAEIGQCPGWEWVELFNNTGSTIDFSSTHYVFDDDDDVSLLSTNVNSGVIAQGATGVLFNASAAGTTEENMKAAWGQDINFIPVSTWTDLTNTGDTIALWSNLASYSSETQSTMPPRRTTNNATVALVYDDDTMLGWPANNNASSIFLANLSSNPATPGSWLRSSTANSVTPQAVLAEVIDHPGNDTGSPGFVPGVVTTLPGDFTNNGVVDAADYVWWRENDRTTSGYDTWRANFGRTAASGGGLGSTNVPEPTTVAQTMFSISLIFVCGRARRKLRR